MYYYVKNLQGDIVRIVDSSGTVVVNYSYNVWGKSLSVDYNSNNSSELNAVLTLNSLRYRGYVYDDETTNIFNTNLFTYCNNNFRASDYNGKYSNYYSSKTYNRNNALTYARLNYYKKQGNSMFRYYGGKGGDCANFVSQCLYFGGIRMSTGWHFFKGILKDDWTASWISAPAQYKYFRLWGFTKYIITIDKEDYFDKRCLRRIITHYGIKSGDLMYMDFNGDGEVDHATMITGHSFGTELYFTAHSDSKYGFPVRRVFYDTQNRRWRKPKMILKIVVLL